MKKKAAVALGIILLVWGIVALIACIQIIIEDPNSFPSLVEKFLFVDLLAILPLLCSYLLLRKYLKKAVLKKAFIGSTESKEKLEEQLAKYFKPSTLQVPAGKVVTIPQIEEEITFKIEELDRRSLHNSFFIKYKDASGRASQRRITIYDIVPYGYDDFYLESFCHERKANRTFCSSRLEEIIDLETGEIIEDKSAFFFDKYYKMNEDPVQQLIEDKESEVLVLMFIARADGVLRKKELDVIVDYLLIHSGRSIEKESLIKELKKVHCLVQEFKKHIRFINETSSYDAKAELLKCINDVILADKKSDPLELAGLEIIKKIFKVKSRSVIPA